MSRAKDAYEKFQDAMGNWERTPFEHLSNREMEAWSRFGGLDEIGIDALEEAREDRRQMRKEVTKYQNERNEMKSQCDALKDENESLRRQIHSFDEKFQADQAKLALKLKPAKAKKGGKR